MQNGSGIIGNYAVFAFGVTRKELEGNLQAHHSSGAGGRVSESQAALTVVFK